MKKERWLAALGGVGVGILNGLLGAGGGMLTVPLLEWMGVKGRRAHATSLAVILPLSLVSAGAGYWEVAVMTLVANARYLLMSCALSQKFHPKTSCIHRFLVGFGITDEIFGITIGRSGSLNPYYNYGAMMIALPSWSVGTAIGIVAGNILPASIVSALSVALYGMFIAIIVPASKADRIVRGVVAVSFLISFAVSKISLFDAMSDSMKISLLTVVIAGAAAYLFPAKSEEEDEPVKDSFKEVPEYDS